MPGGVRRSATASGALEARNRLLPGGAGWRAWGALRQVSVCLTAAKAGCLPPPGIRPSRRGDEALPVGLWANRAHFGALFRIPDKAPKSE